MSASTSWAARQINHTSPFFLPTMARRSTFSVPIPFARSLVIAGIDLAFPVILRALTNLGCLFTEEGSMRLWHRIGMVAVGLSNRTSFVAHAAISCLPRVISGGRPHGIADAPRLSTSMSGFSFAKPIA